MCWKITLNSIGPKFGLMVWLAVCFSAPAFYNPATGRWLSRDPESENGGGPNIYAFAANNAATHYDFLGLEWQVWRTGTQRAGAHGECGDTMRTLATKVHLDPSEYRQWATPIAGEGLPDSPDEALKGFAWFSIPNKVYVNRAGSWPAWIMWETPHQAHALWMQGFRVESHVNIDNDAVSRQFTDPDIYGFVNVSHGEEEQYGHGEIETTDPRGLRLVQVQNALHHKLGGYMLIQCWGDEIDWRAILAPRAYYWAGHGKIHYWNVPTARFSY